MLVLFHRHFLECFVFLTETWSYAEWEKKIQNAFEEKFWISEEPNLEIEGEETGWVHKRGIYKDCYKASHRFADYQLRPNFPMAMAVVSILYIVIFVHHKLFPFFLMCLILHVQY